MPAGALYAQVVKHYDEAIGERIEGLKKLFEEENVDELLGFTYKAIIDYQKKKIELVMNPVQTILVQLQQAEKKVFAAEKLFIEAQEQRLDIMRKACAKLDGFSGRWKEFKADILGRKSHANDKKDDHPIASGDAMIDAGTQMESADMKTPSRSQERQVTLSGSPFVTGDGRRRWTEKTPPVRRLVFDESSVAGSSKVTTVPAYNQDPVASACLSSQKYIGPTHQATSSLALPEMPKFQSQTVKSIVSKGPYTLPKESQHCVKKMEPLSEDEYVLASKEVQSVLTLEELNRAIELLNERLLKSKLAPSRLCSTTVMAVLVPGFSLKQCNGVFAALSALNRLKD